MNEHKQAQQKLKRRGNRHAQPEVREQQIIQAAIQCFGEQGFFNTRMDDIVRTSGLSKGSLYRFFQSKDELLMRIVDGWYTAAETGLLRYSKQYEPIEALKQYCLYTLDIFQKDKPMLGVWVQFFSHHQAREQLVKLHQYERLKMQQILRLAKQNGDIKIESPMAAADHLRAILEGTMFISAIDPQIDAKKRFLHAWQGFETSLK